MAIDYSKLEDQQFDRSSKLGRKKSLLNMVLKIFLIIGFLVILAILTYFAALNFSGQANANELTLPSLMVELEEHNGRLVYELETLRNGVFYESLVDPVSGLTLMDEKESPLLWKPLSDQEKRAFQSTKITMVDAIMRAQKNNSLLISEATFSEDCGKYFFNLVFADGTDARVDAMSGMIEKM